MKSNESPLPPTTRQIEILTPHAHITGWWDGAAGGTLRLLLLALTVIVLWCIVYNRWGGDFSVPTRYDYFDTNLNLGQIKIAKDGDYPLIGRVNSSALGAPFDGNQNDFPIINRIYWATGKLANIFGLFSAANIMLIGLHLLAAFSFYFAARLWRISRLSSWSFSVLYSTIPQFEPSINLFTLISFGLLPLQFYTCWYIAKAPIISWKSNRFRLALVVGGLSSTFFIYWSFLFTQTYFISLIYRFFTIRTNLIKATLPIIATLSGIFLFLSSHLSYALQYGKNVAAVARNYGWIEIFSLKPVGMLLPPHGNAFNLLKPIYYRYSKEEIGLLESYLFYIGLAAIVGISLLVIKSFSRQLKGRALPLPFLLLAWIIAYSSFGGLNSLFSLVFEFYKIRGTGRYAVAVATIGILYFAFFFDRKTIRWRLLPRLILVSFTGIIGLGDHTGKAYTGSRVHLSPGKLLPRIEGDRALVLRLESTLPERAMLFMLPVMSYPEGFHEIKGLEAYALMRPFLHSTKLHYSFGSDRGRQGADWQFEVRDLPAGKMASTLESYGFAGILLNRKGYDDRGEALLAELATEGWPMEFEQGVDNEWVFIRLTPSADPVLPTLTPYALSEPRHNPLIQD